MESFRSLVYRLSLRTKVQGLSHNLPAKCEGCPLQELHRGDTLDVGKKAISNGYISYQ